MYARSLQISIAKEIFEFVPGRMLVLLSASFVREHYDNSEPEKVNMSGTQAAGPGSEKDKDSSVSIRASWRRPTHRTGEIAATARLTTVSLLAY